MGKGIRDSFNKAVGGSDPRRAAFFTAVAEGDLGTVARIISFMPEAVEWTNPDDDGKTALIIAAENGETEILSLLLASDADVNAQTVRGTTGLVFAAYAGNSDVVQILIDAGAKTSLANESGTSPLMGAAWSGDLRTANLLMQGGADKDAQDSDGMSALMYAAQQGHDVVITALIAEEADTGLTNNSGYSASGIARGCGYLNCVQLIDDAAQAAPVKPAQKEEIYEAADEPAVQQEIEKPAKKKKTAKKEEAAKETAEEDQKAEEAQAQEQDAPKKPAPEKSAKSKKDERDINEMISDLQKSAKEAVDNINTPAPAEPKRNRVSELNERFKKGGIGF